MFLLYSYILTAITVFAAQRNGFNYMVEAGKRSSDSDPIRVHASTSLLWPLIVIFYIFNATKGKT